MNIKHVHLRVPLNESSQLLLLGLREEIESSLVELPIKFPELAHVTIQYLGERSLVFVQDLARRISETLDIKSTPSDNNSLHKIGYRDSFVFPETNFLLLPHSSNHIANAISVQLFGSPINVHTNLFSLSHNGVDRTDELLRDIASRLKSIRDTSFVKPYCLQPDFSRLQIVGVLGGQKQVLEEIDLTG